MCRFCIKIDEIFEQIAISSKSAGVRYCGMICVTFDVLCTLVLHLRIKHCTNATSNKCILLVRVRGERELCVTIRLHLPYHYLPILYLPSPLYFGSRSPSVLCFMVYKTIIPSRYCTVQFYLSVEFPRCSVSALPRYFRKMCILTFIPSDELTRKCWLPSNFSNQHCNRKKTHFW